MKIAIIGSGFFGTAIALKLSKKHSVDIFEKKNDILQGASSANQYRFHLGYHYPRSQKTVKEISKSNGEFIKFFGEKIFGNTQNYYGIARNETKTNIKNYFNFLKKNKLFYKIINNNLPKIIEGVFLTKEKILNYFLFKKKLFQKLRKNKNIKIFFNSEFKKKYLQLYDKIILCTYNNNNQIIKELGCKLKVKYKYELVEKIIVKLPNKYKNQSYVILDGNFVCVDPYLGTPYHLLSDVKHSKIEVIKDYLIKFKSSKKKYVNKGIIRNIKKSNFNKFINNSSRFLPFLKKSKYIGSLYTIRTLQMNKEKTDERINSIKIINDKIISIFSSKWNTCVYLANYINKIIND